MVHAFDYLRTLEELEPQILEAVARVLRSNALILGPETTAFENEFAAWLGIDHCVGVASGTAALQVALAALDIGAGAEVITVANTCPPTISAIRQAGAVPRFVDIHPDSLMMNLEAVRAAITPQTRAIIAVHLWGSMVDMPELARLAREHGLRVIEDCAQSTGSTWSGRPSGTFGDAGCFSFYPTKNLGAYGDAGAVVTHDAALAARLRRIRMYGYEQPGISLELGMNARIAEVQAAILRVKLPHLDRWIEARRAAAASYDEHLSHAAVRAAARPAEVSHSFHQYVVRCGHRDALREHLRRHNIGHGIHYAVPVHQMPAFRGFARAPLPETERASGEILSLPMHESLRTDELEAVAEAVNTFTAE